jgi:hypothetical protein
MSKARGRYNRFCHIKDIFNFLFRLTNSRLLINYLFFILRSEIKHADSILSRIPVTDIAQPRGVNAMKVSER